MSYVRHLLYTEVVVYLVCIILIQLGEKAMAADAACAPSKQGRGPRGAWIDVYTFVMTAECTH